MKPPRDSSCLLRSSAAARRFSSCCSSLVCSSSMDWRCRTRSSILLSSALLVVAPAVAGTAAAAGGETKSCSEPEFETGIAGLACREYKAKAFHGSASSQSFPQRATTMATMARRLNMAFFAQQASETVSVSKIYQYGHSHRRPRRRRIGGDAHRAELVFLPAAAMSPDVGSATAPPVATSCTCTSGQASESTEAGSNWNSRTSAFFQGCFAVKNNFHVSSSGGARISVGVLSLT